MTNAEAQISLAKLKFYMSGGGVIDRKANEALNMAIKALEQPERKTGQWIDEPVYRQTMDGKTWDGYTYCSVCKEMHEYGYRSKFCPNCGSEMRGEEDE